MTLTDETLTYHAQALDSPTAMRYFAERGLTTSSVQRFKLGWITSPLSEQASKHVGQPVIPYVTLSGKVIWAKVRTGWPKPYPKYLPLGSDYPLPEPKVHLFNARQAMPSMRRRDVYLIEGEFDTIIAHQCGLKAVGVPSANVFYGAWLNLFSDARVTIALDGDDAGQQGAERLAVMFRQARVEHEIRPLPAGSDVTDLYLQGGRELVYETLGAAA